MSLTVEDLSQIRTIVSDVLHPLERKIDNLEHRFDNLELRFDSLEHKVDDLANRLEAVENDVKEIYFMIARLGKSSITDSSFKKLSLENKLLKLNAELLAAAKQAGITLPR